MSVCWQEVESGLHGPRHQVTYQVQSQSGTHKTVSNTKGRYFTTTNAISVSLRTFLIGTLPCFLSLNYELSWNREALWPTAPK